jgi:mono/diheme cytochrome c family protein
MDMTRAAGITGTMVLLLLQPALQSQRPAATPVARRTAAATVTAMPAGNAEHGRYLVEHVAMCIECHSGRDSRGVILESERYLGAPIPFAPPWPNDWAMRAPRNRGLPGYSDELAFRLLTQGAIGRNGEHLRPPMPRFRMSAQDAADVIAYMRSPT